MPWTTMSDLNPGDLVDEVIWDNQVKGNLEHLLAGQPLATVTAGGAADYTTTSTTYSNVDATNMKLAMTPASSRVLLLAAFRGGADNTAGNSLYVRWNEATAGPSLFLARVGQNSIQLLGLIHLYTELTPGTTYTFYLQFASAESGGTSTIYRASWWIALIGLEV